MWERFGDYGDPVVYGKMAGGEGLTEPQLENTQLMDYSEYQE